MLEFRGERLDFNVADDEDFMQHLNRYAFAKPFCTGSVLDLACGVGYGTYFLSDKTDISTIVGGDISEEAIKYAQATFANNKTHFQLESATKTTFTNNSFNTIISIETVEHIKEIDIFFTEATRLLNENGTFIMSLPNKKFFLDEGFENAFHFNEMYYSELNIFLSTYFKKNEMYYQFYPIERYNRIHPKLNAQKTVVAKKNIRSFIPLPLKQFIGPIIKHLNYSKLSKNSVREIYGFEFQKFLDNNSNLRDQYRIVPIEEQIYNKIPGNFMAVCQGAKQRLR